MTNTSTKTLAAVASAAALALALAGCAGQSADADTDGGGEGLPVISAGTLTVCISKNAYPPMYWNDGGTLTGFDVDSIAAIAADLGLEVSFSEMAFDGLLPALVAERCDVLRSGLYINDERQAAADAIAYLETGPALIVPADNPLSLTSIDDLPGIRIAAQAASANERQLQELSEQFVADGLAPLEISSYPELPETIAALTNGRVDATIETDVAAAQAAETLGDDYTVLDTLFPAGTQFGMYLPKDSALTATITEVAERLTEDGTFADIAQTYGLNPDRLVAP